VLRSQHGLLNEYTFEIYMFRWSKSLSGPFLIYNLSPGL
jgi:hypothetical protein